MADRKAHALRSALACLALLVGLALGAGPAAAEVATVSVRVEGAYGRLVIDFPERNILPPHKINWDNGVLVLSFEQPVDMDVSRVPSVLNRFVTIARKDPEGRGVRFALARSVKVSTLEAGAKLFLDFLPENWNGPAPPLPNEVIVDLARRAEAAAKAAKEAEVLRSSGAKTAKLDVRVARGPTFSRFTFKLNVPFEADFQREDAGINVFFNRQAAVDIAEIRAALPPFVDDISTSRNENGVTVSLAVSPAADVRAFREENTYVVDIQGPVDETALSGLDAAVHEALSVDDHSPASATSRVMSPGKSDAVVGPDPGAANAPAPARSGTTTAPQAPAPANAPAAPPVAAAAPPSPPPLGTEPVEIISGPADGAPDLPSDEAPSAARNAGLPPPGGGAAVAEMPDGQGERMLADDTIRVEAKRVGRATRVVFPYPKEVGSALFTRGAALWLVFDDPAPIDPAPLQDALAGFARSIEPIKLGDARALRIELAEPLLATLNPDGTFWVVTIGDMVMEPTRPLPIKRAVREDGTTSLDVPFGPVAAIHRIADPAVGDTLVVVTGKGQPRGLIKPQSFAEVDALSSAHGLAFAPKVDDLLVQATGELVSVDRPTTGLSVTTALPPKRSAVLDLPAAIGSSLGGRAGFVDFSGTEAKTPPEFWEKRHELMAEIAATRDKDERIDRWFRAAKFNLANGLGPEAMGILNLVQTLSPEEETSERMVSLRAGASLLMYRPKDVLALLDRPDLEASPDAAVWRAIAEAELGNYTEARKHMPRAESVIGSFPTVIQQRFLLAGVATAIELNDYGKARSLLSEIDPRSLSNDERAQLDLLNARAIDASGNAGDAIELLSNIVRTHKGPVAAEATFRLVRMQRREGLITLDQGVDRLEQLAVSWRGDEIELNTLRTLGQWSVERGNFRRAFEVMRTAELIDPTSDTTRMMQEEMQAAFASLYLDGKADEMKPIDALALYYDFRELTPPGRRGDAMVRKLADRLVDADLLQQAQKLLAYQVENRLHGVARAQVAADLAMVYLLDRRPDRALLTLSRTRQSDLPVAIERQRRSVEAKALADTGKIELALDLLGPLGGGDVERLKAEILWGSDRYTEAGEQYERLLGGRWREPVPLSDDEQLAVLKAGIAFTLAGDRLSLDRLRAKYTNKMAESANAAAFEAVTGPILANGDAFDDIVRSVASRGTMEAFLADYRRRYLDLGNSEKPALVGATEGAEAEPAVPAPAAG